MKSLPAPCPLIKTYNDIIMKRLFSAILLLGLLVACNKSGFSAATTAVREHTFLTGECLKDNTLKPHVYEDTGLPYRVEKRFNAKTNKDEQIGITIALQLNLDKEYLPIAGQTDKTYGWLPTDAVFSSFGNSAQTVKNDFNAVYGNFNKSRPHSETVTIYYGDVEITSNAEVCGVAPGENLYPSVFNFSSIDSASACSYQLPEDTIPEGYFPLNPYAVFTILAKDGHEVVDGNPTFYFKIPVKVGMYLTYLNDKRTNPEAKMQYRDEVLTHTITIGKNVR